MIGNLVSNPNFQYTKGEIGNLLKKALLTSDAAVGGALAPQHLERLITNTIVALAPEIAVITPKFDSQRYHEFNRTTALPAQGGAIGEGGVTPINRSTFERAGEVLKVVRRKGAVSNFLKDASEQAYDALAIETENHLQAHVYDLVTYILYGNKIADTYSFDGLDKFISTYRTNKAVGGVVPADLIDLDTLIDQNMTQQGANHNKCLVMSPQMLSKFSRLLTNVRLNQNSIGGGLSTVEIKGGWRLQAYRDVPIIASTQVRPTLTMGTVAIATATTGGSIADASHNYFRVSKITRKGESLAYTEVDIATTGGSVSTITLSWSDQTDAFYYKIYYSATTGTETLIKIVAAQHYDSVGTPDSRVTSATLTTVAADTNATTGSITTAMSADVPLVGSTANPPEIVLLWDLDEIQGMGKLAYTNSDGSKYNGIVTIEPLAKTDDNMPFLIKTYAALIPSFEATSGIIRGLKCA